MKRLGIALVLLAATACAKNGSPAVASAPPTATPRPGGSIVVTSPAFAANGDIPVKYTCQGAGVSPPLQWTNVPKEAKELALVAFDPDAGNGGFVHWVVFKIPPTATSFAEGSLPAGVREAKNGTGKASYLGPCPPAGKVHHYQFTLSALYVPIDLPNGSDATAVRAQITNKSIAGGLLVGLYQRH